jgi:hypothetical protein
MSRNYAWGCWYVSHVSIIFYCSILLCYHSWMFYNHFIATLHHFLGLTYWHSAQCQLLFSALFLFHRIQYLKESKCSETFWRFFWTRGHPLGQGSTTGGPEGGTTHHGTPGPPGASWCLVLTSELLSGTSLAHWMSSGPKKSPKSFTAFGLHLIWIFYETKTGQK